VGGWRRLHNEELCNLYASQNILGMIKMRLVGQVAQMRIMYKILVGNPKGKMISHGRYRCKWEDNIKMDFKRYRAGCCGLDSCGSG